MAVQRVTPYGLKEVADVYLDPAGTTVSINTSATGTTYGDIVTASTDPDFIFDTLKVSNTLKTEEVNPDLKKCVTIIPSIFFIPLSFKYLSIIILA